MQGCEGWEQVRKHASESWEDRVAKFVMKTITETFFPQKMYQLLAVIFFSGSIYYAASWHQHKHQHTPSVSTFLINGLEGPNGLDCQYLKCLLMQSRVTVLRAAGSAEAPWFQGWFHISPSLSRWCFVGTQLGVASHPWNINWSCQDAKLWPDLRHKCASYIKAEGWGLVQEP